MSQSKYTVFVTNKVSGTDGFLMRSELKECIDFAATEDNFVLVCWAPEVPRAFGGEKHSPQLRAESIAAGRVIKLIDGKYVPFENGAPVVPIEEKPAEYTPEQLAWILRGKRPSATAPVTDPNAAMIARDERAEREFCNRLAKDAADDLEQVASTAKPALASLTSSPDLAGEWKPFEFGSAHLKG